ncbi:unnamed protein product [Microthlaspi erraticum]|uniref:Endonuclease/exonuclease/phosphatase domain-containing protein n=1 Tax=Microthlaspi erraticum TaxID=1685480 RepID=A0A6D2K0I8_9BRAS|nr:unnamed protein product [Microthlaspi erraticum]
MHRPWYANGLRGREAYSPARAAWSCASRRDVMVACPTAGQCSRVVICDRPVISNFGRDFRKTDMTLAERETIVSRQAGLRVVKLRDLVWERITRIGTTRTDPWFLIGDFNEITGNHEKQGGPLRQASSFVSFNLMISDCGFVDFPSRGNTLSWRGRRRGKIVRCRLDRALATEDWHDLFPVSHVQYLPMIGSDHRPILATLDSNIMKRRKQFRFDKRWIGLEGLLESIKRGWDTTRGEVDPSLVDRIQNCRHEISGGGRTNNPTENRR